MKERELNKDSETIIFSNIPIIGEVLYGDDPDGCGFSKRSNADNT